MESGFALRVNFRMPLAEHVATAPSLISCIRPRAFAGNSFRTPISACSPTAASGSRTLPSALHTTAANLDGIRAAVGLPDLHPPGYPVGAAFFSTGHFYPALVGGDRLRHVAARTDLAVHKTSAPSLKKPWAISTASPQGTAGDRDMEHLQQIAQTSGVADLAYLLRSLGTIGGGNHFAELQQIETLYEEGALDKKRVHLMVHSGSRGLGGSILREHAALQPRRSGRRQRSRKAIPAAARCRH
jgi:hypothetical protein